MVWSCEACTFENSIDHSIQCAMCETKRERKQQKLEYKHQQQQSQSSVIEIDDDDDDDDDENKEQSKAPHQYDNSYYHKKTKTTTTTKRTKQATLFEAGRGSSAFSSIVLKDARDGNNNKSNINEKVQTDNIGSRGNNDKKIKSAIPKTCTSNNAPIGRKLSTTSNTKNKKFQIRWEKAMKLMKEVFKIDQLRKQQPFAVECALKDQSQIVVMATGGGKSLCYQLPAVVLEGLTVVISPLIALMVDQVNALNEKGIQAACISSANGERYNSSIMQRLLIGCNQQTKQTSDTTNKQKQDIDSQKPLTLVYCTPELMITEKFRTILDELNKNKRLSLFAIDEAHCMSTWGHDFRPAYRKLGYIRTKFPNIPVMACTATATPKVIEDIKETLNFNSKGKNGKDDDYPCHIGTFDRPNIYYKVKYKDSLNAFNPNGAIEDLVQFIKKQHERCLQPKQNENDNTSDNNDNENPPCSGIVYVHKREDTTTIANQINRSFSKVQQGHDTDTNNIKVRAGAYHGGLKDNERKQVQEDWMNGTIQVAIATIAFGMGIDLQHVRYVIHWNISKTLEGFYQESGRAGRDGLPSFSLLYYSKSDAEKFGYLIKQRSNNNGKGNVANEKLQIQQQKVAFDALEKMNNYCISHGCRRQYILNHFGEEITDPLTVCRKTCDYCNNPEKVENAIQLASCANAVRNTHKFATKSNKKSKGEEWDGQWNKPYGDDDNDDEYDNDCSLGCTMGFTNNQYNRSNWKVGDLAITGVEEGGITEGPLTNTNHNTSSSSSHPVAAFVKASSVLDKYEVLEVRENNGKNNSQNGFVRFRSITPTAGTNTSTNAAAKKNSIRSRLLSQNNNDDDNGYNNSRNDNSSTSKTRLASEIRVPDHLRSQLLDRLHNKTATNKKSSIEKEKTQKTSAEIAKDTDRLKEELEQLKKKREALLLKKQNSSSTSSSISAPPPPPPSLCFSKPNKKKRRRHD